MKFHASIDDTEHGQDIASLWRWVIADPDLRDISVRREVRAQEVGRMNGSFDAIVAVTSQAIAFGNLLLAYVTWRAAVRGARESGVTVAIEIDGRLVELSGLSDQQIQNLVSGLQGRERIE
ncbi:hypothetical protein ACH4TE_35020 [Streptomyces sioyaensis]|uniref:effector-associated constant component EACC1 n=1 Tax=Streptomyces sioyaensis TaxID=67364 RepID=UPI0037AC3407